MRSHISPINDTAREGIHSEIDHITQEEKSGDIALTADMPCNSEPENRESFEQDIESTEKHYENAEERGGYDEIKRTVLTENSALMTADEWNALGEKFFEAKNYDEAQVCYEKAVELHQGHKNALYSLGFIFEKIREDIEKAKDYYKRASDLGHYHSTIFFLKIDNPETTTAEDWSALACDYYKGENGKEKDLWMAFLCFKLVIELKPKNARSLYSLGAMLTNGQGVEKDVVRAKEYYKRAAALGYYLAIKKILLIDNPKLKTAREWFNLGEEYFHKENKKTRDYKYVRACNEKAIEIDPNYISSLYRLGHIFQYRHKKIADAKKYYQRASKLGDLRSEVQLMCIENPETPVADLWYSLGKKHYFPGNDETQNLSEAKKCFEQATKLDPEHKDSWHLLGSIFEKDSDDIECLKKVILCYKKAVTAGCEKSKSRLTHIKNKTITTLLYVKLRNCSSEKLELKNLECEKYTKILSWIDAKYEKYKEEEFKTEIRASETAEHTFFGSYLSDDSDSDDEKTFRKSSNLIRQSALTHSFGLFNKADLPSAKKIINELLTEEKKIYPQGKQILKPKHELGKAHGDNAIIQKDLKDLNYWRAQGKLSDGLKRITTKFVIAHYRGIHYKTTDWSQPERQAHRKANEAGQALYSASVYKAAEEPFIIERSAEVEKELEIQARDIKNRLLALRASEPYHAEFKHKKESTMYSFENVGYYIQDTYTKAYDKFHEILKNSLSINKQNKPKKDVPNLNLLNDANPFVSTGDTPLHACKYAYGVKPYKGHEHERLHPQWNKGGRAERPYSGKVYLTLHTIEEYDADKPLHVVSLNHLGKLRLDATKGQMILQERETSFPAYLPKGRVVYTHIAKYPSFVGDYKEIYAIKYGIDKELYELFQESLTEFAPHTSKMENIKVLMGEYLCHYHQLRLVEQARHEAEKINSVLVYIDEYGNLSLNLPLLPRTTGQDNKNLNAIRQSNHVKKTSEEDNSNSSTSSANGRKRKSTSTTEKESEEDFKNKRPRRQ